MKEMLGYQVDEEAASLKMSSSFKLDPTTLIGLMTVFDAILTSRQTGLK